MSTYQTASTQSIARIDNTTTPHYPTPEFMRFRWLLDIEQFAERYPELGLQPDIACMSITDLHGLHVFLLRYDCENRHKRES